MAKKILTPSAVATNNVSNLADQVVGQAATVKGAMDQYGIDDKDYNNNTLLAELQDSSTPNQSGSFGIGHNSNGIDSDNVGDALIELYQRIINGFPPYSTLSINANKYIGNTKTIDTFQDATPYRLTGGTGSISDDTTNKKIGAQGVKLTESASGIQGLGLNSDNLILDLTKFNDGSEVTDNDWFYIVRYIPDISKLTESTGNTIRFSSDAVFGSNYFYRNFTLSELKTGWNFLKVQRSEFLEVGTGSDWSNIQSFRVGTVFAATGTNDSVTEQFIQLIKSNAEGTAPYPFQYLGTEECEIANDVEAVVVEEFGSEVIKVIDGSSEEALLFNNSYNDFVASIISKSESATSEGGLSWYTDANNYVSCTVGSDTLQLRSRIAGVNTDSSVAFTVDPGDLVIYKLEKKGVNITLTAYKNLDLSTSVTLIGTTSLTSGKLSIRKNSGVDRTVLSSCVTELGHSYSSTRSDITDAVNTKIQNGAFTSDELEYGQLGLDKSNDRLYMKYSDTQVIYFAGTVV